jgi:hypothetical protein
MQSPKGPVNWLMARSSLKYKKHPLARFSPQAGVDF